MRSQDIAFEVEHTNVTKYFSKVKHVHSVQCCTLYTVYTGFLRMTFAICAQEYIPRYGIFYQDWVIRNKYYCVASSMTPNPTNWDVANAHIHKSRVMESHNMEKCNFWIILAKL